MDKNRVSFNIFDLTSKYFLECDFIDYNGLLEEKYVYELNCVILSSSDGLSNNYYLVCIILIILI